MKANRLLILLLLCAVLVAFVPNPNLPLTVEATPASNWWDSNYNYRKSFNVTGQSSTETNYQIEILVYRTSGSDSGNSVYLNGKCEIDYDDIRFTNDEASPTVLDYWIEWSNSNLARVWVELDSITASSTDTFYIYYGYSSASAYSNGDNTFNHFDDFDTDGYTYTNPPYVNVDEGGDERVEWTSSGAYNDGEDGASMIAGEWAFECYLEFSSMAGFAGIRIFLVDISQSTWGWASGTDGAGIQLHYGTNFVIYAVENGATTTDSETGWSTGTTYYARATYDGSTFRAYLYTDYWDTLAYDGVCGSVSFSDAPDTVIFQNRDRTGAVGWADDFRIRHWISDDPQGSNWGSEETNFAPTIDSDPTNTFAMSNIGDRYQIGCYSGVNATAETVVQDLDGWSDIDYVNFSLYDTGRSTEIWRAQYTQAGDSFTAVINTDRFIILGSGSTVINSTSRTLWFAWVPTENHTDSNDFDIKVIAVDDSALSVTKWVENSFGFSGVATEIDVDPELDFPTWYYVVDLNDADGRGNINEDLRLGYALQHREFVDSGGINTSLIDMWINCTSGTAWEIDAPAYNSLTLIDTLIDAPGTVGNYFYYFRVTAEGSGVNGYNIVYSDSISDSHIADKVTISPWGFPSREHYHLGYNMTTEGAEPTPTLTYDFDSGSYGGSFTWDNDTFMFTSPVKISYNVSSISGDAYGITEFTGGISARWFYWENTTYAWSDIWTKYTTTQYYNHITISNLEWSASGVSVQDGATITLLRNGTTWGTTTTSSSIAQFVVPFTPGWNFANYTVKIYYVAGKYNITTQVFIKSQRVSVPTLNTLYLDVFDIDFTDDYFYITWETNWHNATLTIWDNTSLIDYYTTEGVSQISLSSVQGLHQLVLLINGSTHAQGTYNASFPDNVKWIWRFLNYSVSLEATTMHFAYYMADGSPLLFHAFKTYIDGYRLPPEKPYFVTTATTVNLTITDVWNATVYQDTTLTVAGYVDIITASYWLLFTNQRDYAVNVTIQFNSRNWTVPYSLGYGQGFERVIYTGNYTMWVWRVSTGQLEPGFPTTQNVTSNWEVYTERTIPGGEDTGGSQTIISPAWVPVIAVLIVILILGVYYDIKKRRK